jgi:hypothetical protein
VGCKKSLETVQDLHKGLPTATRGIELLFGDIFEQDGKLEMARRIDAMRLAKDRISGRTSLTKRTLSAGVLIEEYERRGWVRLHEKGGKEHEMPTHHNLDRYLEEYIAAAGIAQDKKGPLFRTTKGRSGELKENPMLQSDLWRMIRRRASSAGIKTEISCHTFRATGTTAYLKNGGKLRSHSRWRRTSPHARPVFMTDATMKSRLMKWSESESDAWVDIDGPIWNRDFPVQLVSLFLGNLCTSSASAS